MDSQQYTINEQLYSGDKHVIYRASRKNDGLGVILKTAVAAFPSIPLQNKLRTEYAFLQGFHHPNIVHAFAIDRIDNKLAIILEDIQGISLSQYSKEHVVGFKEFFSIAIQLVSALQDVHRHHIIHKNVCTSNVLINPVSGEIKLTGFSIAVEQGRETQYPRGKEAFEADIRYISPEQTGRMHGPLDHRTDFYSLGAVFYELLTGRQLFIAHDVLELMHCHIAREPEAMYTIRPDIPPVLSAIVHKLLNKNAEERYQSAAGLAFDLRKWLGMYTSGEEEVFILGESDVSDQFTISGKLYGRQEELAQLYQAVKFVEKGRPQLVLVNGYSGVGKSTLVNQVQKSMTARKAFFVSGKFDQFKRDVPLSAIVAVFRQLIRQLLSGNEQEAAKWNRNIMEAVGSSGQVIIDVVSEAELLIGQQPALPELPPLESNNRFNQVFTRFVSIFCRSEHPLCIFLDDLQWIDSASLRWIETHVTDQQLNYFFLMGAYRDNEVPPSHPLLLMLERLEQNGVPIQKISLQPLPPPALAEMIGDTLCTPPGRCSDLSEIIFKKTVGNPFFTRQCLLSLYENGAIYFDQEKQAWAYDLNLVRKIKISDNVVELMEQLIRRLPAEVQTTLTSAACTGNRFESRMLSHVTGRSADDIHTQLLLAVKEGVIISSPAAQTEGAEEFSFLHDRVQQAALSLLQEEEKKLIRLQTGRFLLSDSADILTEEKIYDIADHLNAANSFITDHTEITQLVSVNLTASIRAKNAAAYEPALRYIKHAMNTSAASQGQKSSSLIMNLCLQRADVEHMCGNNEQAEDYYNQALSFASTESETAGIYQRKIYYYNNLRKFEEAYHTGRQAVKPLGVYLPSKFIPALLLKDFIAYRFLLGRRNIAGIADLPDMKNERLKIAVLLMSTFARAAYQIKPGLCIAVSMKIVILCLRYGITDGVSAGFAASGVIFHGAILNYKQTGYEYGMLVLALVEKYKSAAFKAEAYFVVGYFAIPWKKPATDMEYHWQIAYNAGLESGDLFHASCACCGTIQSYYMRGKHFTEIWEASDRYIDFLTRTKNSEAINTLQAIRLSISNLRGETASMESYNTATFDEDEYVENLRSFGSRHFAHYYFINKMQTLYLWGMYNKAYTISLRSAKYLKDSPGMLHTAEHHFYAALIICALFTSSHRLQRLKWIKILHKARRRFNTYAKDCPSNFMHKFQLLDAEINRVEGNLAEAEKLYYAAIESAGKYEYLHIVALAHELTANFHYTAGRRLVADVHVREAQHAYTNWGAVAYAKFLTKKYPGFSYLGNTTVSQLGELMHPAVPAVEKGRESMLDLATILKSSEAISREIRLRDLLSALMKILIENAGAQRMILLLLKGNELLVHAECVAGTDEVQILPELPIEEYPTISKVIAYYVARTRELVILDDASVSGKFMHDAYISDYKPRSVLCAPLIQQGKLNGIIYLENNLTHAAFSKDRIDLLFLLSGQMAISIENAMLYDNLEQKVIERTEQLKNKNIELEITLETLQESQRRLIHAEKMASLGKMTSGIAHEIQNPLNFVINFAALSQNLLSELKELVAGNGETSTANSEDIRSVIDDLQLNVERIDSNGQRVSTIIKSLVTQTSSLSESMQQADLQLLIDQSIERAVHNFSFIPSAFTIPCTKEYDDRAGTIFCLAGKLSMVLVNIIDNALYAIQQKKNMSGKEFTPGLAVITQDAGDHVKILIRDNGEGIAPDMLDKIFIPFFTTKPTGGGNTGNGLSQSHQIIAEVHHGHIEVDSEPGIFTEFTITLPKFTDHKASTSANKNLTHNQKTNVV